METMIDLALNTQQEKERENTMAQRRRLLALAAFLACLVVGCGNAAMYRPAVAKLTAATNVVIDSSEHILDESRRAKQEAAILEIAFYSNDKVLPERLPESEIKKLENKQIQMVNGALYRPDADALGAPPPLTRSNWRPELNCCLLSSVLMSC